jgi:hypothetical protein
MKISYNKQSKKWEVIDATSLYNQPEIMGEFTSKSQAQRYLNMLTGA